MIIMVIAMAILFPIFRNYDTQLELLYSHDSSLKLLAEALTHSNYDYNYYNFAFFYFDIFFSLSRAAMRFTQELNRPELQTHVSDRDTTTHLPLIEAHTHIAHHPPVELGHTLA